MTLVGFLCLSLEPPLEWARVQLFDSLTMHAPAMCFGSLELLVFLDPMLCSTGHLSLGPRVPMLRVVFTLGVFFPALP
jgi:hypothetical protein